MKEIDKMAEEIADMLASAPIWMELHLLLKKLLRRSPS